jgi:hypothetical protein
MITTINEFKIYRINEQIESNDTEYFDAVGKFYDSSLIQQIKDEENMAKSMTRSSIKTFKTDNGNLIVRYTEGNNMLAILGMVSISGKLNRYDIIDLNTWINYVITQIDNNIKVITSPNELSEPILNKIIDKCKKSNIKLNTNVYNVPNTSNNSDNNWKTYIINKIS